MNAVLYARVSAEEQAKGEKVSIDEQLADMRALCQRMEWSVVREFVDCENYRATQPPKKGIVVNPSGERLDRPRFLEMLELIKTGTVDAVVCWRDDRLVRHPRVAVVLEDALDLGDLKRNGREKTRIHDATGAGIDRFTLSIKATIWREENKRRAERIRMGKSATLKQGRWPGPYWRLGYRTRKEGRGNIIEVDEESAEIVRMIHQMFDSGVGIFDIRRHLVKIGARQNEYRARALDWGIPTLYKLLRSESYTGVATWDFGDGTSMSIQIPAIISKEQWQRNQDRLARNRLLSTRNAKGVYMLQGLLYCGECERALTVCRPRFYMYNGKRCEYKTPQYKYHCSFPSMYVGEPHPRPYNFSGPGLDWVVWRFLVDRGIHHPELICEQVAARQAELRAQGDHVDGDISHARRRLAEVDQERAFYQRQAGRGKITEIEFDLRMEETEDALHHWQEEIERLHELRDSEAKVEAALAYATELLTGLQSQVPDIDQTPQELKSMSLEARTEVLRARQKVVRALCQKVYVWANGHVEIQGMLDGSEAGQFDLRTPRDAQRYAGSAPPPQCARTPAPDPAARSLCRVPNPRTRGSPQ